MFRPDIFLISVSHSRIINLIWLLKALTDENLVINFGDCWQDSTAIEMLDGLFAHFIVIKNGRIGRCLAHMVCIIYLIHADHSFVKVWRLNTIIDLLLGIQIDGAVVNSQLVALEEGDSDLVLVVGDHVVETVGRLDLVAYL